MEIHGAVTHQFTRSSPQMYQIGRYKLYDTRCRYIVFTKRHYI